MRRLGAMLWLALMPAAVAQTQVPPDIRRVVVIHLDSTRPGDLGCYGGLAATPAIDALAARGRRYDHAIAVTPEAEPSIATFLTGRQTIRHGVYLSSHVLQPQLTRLPEVLREAGFVTAAFASDEILGPSDRHDGLGFDQGFDVYETGPFGDGRACDALTEKALRFVDEHSDDRFFLWMFHHDPAPPFAPAAPFDTMYADHPQLLEESVRLGPAVIDLHAYDRGRLDSHEYVARHLGEVSMVDRAIGRLVARLDELPGRTLFIVTAVHGMSLGDVGRWFGHGLDIRHGSVNVPLIVACDGLVPEGVSTSLVANTDLAPTVLDLLGLDREVLDADGRSLVPTFTEAEPWPDRMEPVQAHMGTSWRGVRSARYSLQSMFVEDGREHARSLLYDVLDDPRETVDLAAARPGVLEAHLVVEREWFTRPRIRPQVLELVRQAEAPSNR